MVQRWDDAVGSESRIEKTPDGRLICQGLFCRAGILTYKQPDNSIIRELRRPETNQAVLNAFKLLPVTIEHPLPGILNTESYKDYAVGLSGNDITFDPTSGGISGSVVLYDGQAIRLAESRQKSQLSAGYTCDLIEKPGEWDGEPFDREQVNIIPNHIALTASGRGGEKVALRLDSSGNIETKSMAKLRIDASEFDDVPPHLAVAVSQKITEFEGLANRYDALAIENKEILTENDRLKFHIDSLQKELEQYKKDAEGDNEKEMKPTKKTPVKQGKTEKKSTKKPFDDTDEDNEEEDYPDDDNEEEDDDGIDPEEDEMDEDEDEMDEDEDEIDDEPLMKKGKSSKEKSKQKSKQKTDRADHVDSFELEKRVTTWVKADSLIPNYTASYFNPSLSSLDVMKDVISQYRPEVSTENNSEVYLRGVFDSLIAEYRDVDYSSRLDSVIQTSGNPESVSSKHKEKMDNCKKPLTMSKKKG